MATDYIEQGCYKDGEGRWQTYKLAECANCEWRGRTDTLDAVSDLTQRVASGETMPAGQCPNCGALAHPVEGQCR